ncbi:unnamed protein product [Microthlaspi erraticum]|uniref:Uncharacterized protein n=1 Tax=Microthlaspi erraticum TaxID=1685480 RepID=A0A6D2KJD0_9BRAS|nr:unnamed protein product [Microthlaspi erraticum]
MESDTLVLCVAENHIQEAAPIQGGDEEQPDINHFVDDDDEIYPPAFNIQTLPRMHFTLALRELLEASTVRFLTVHELFVLFTYRRNFLPPMNQITIPPLETGLFRADNGYAKDINLVWLETSRIISCRSGVIFNVRQTRMMEIDEFEML